MYEETFGTDWRRLGPDEALRRAFALGVAEGLGRAPEGELDRLKSQLSGRYGRSLVELAYDEGRTKGRTPGPGEDDEAVWTDLVGEEPTAIEPPDRSARPAPPRATDLPGSISAPTLVELGIGRDDLARLGLPDFLR